MKLRDLASVDIIFVILAKIKKFRVFGLLFEVFSKTN